MSGVEVRVDTTDGIAIGRAESDDQGRFVFTGLDAGTYVVTARREGLEPATVTGTVTEGETWSPELTLAETPAVVELPPAVVRAPRLAVSPDIGAPTYEISSRMIRDLPGGENNSLSQILLQAPGVAQDGSAEGAIHVRNQMGNLQYRINGVTMPEGATLFSQTGGLGSRMASSVTLLTGALPAEYGLRTTGIFEVQTKSGAFDPGGYVAMYGGSQSWWQPSVEYGGTTGRLTFFTTGDYLENNLGISPATPGGAIHDHTRQGHGFGFFEYRLDDETKLELVAGTFVGHFEIPNSPGAQPAFVVNGVTAFDSTRIDETQQEQNHFAVLSYRRAAGPLDVQLSAYARYSSLAFRPDQLADMLFNGIAQTMDRSSIATGAQLDAGYALTPTHALRGGLLLSVEQTSVQTTSLVLPAEDGVQTSDQPFSVFDSTGKIGYTYSAYLQDTWRIVPSLAVTVGLRLDGIDAFTQEWQLSPRLNLVWDPTPTTRVRAGYARYFTPPRQEFVSVGSIAKFANTTAAPEVTEDSAPRAERAHYLDAGVSQQIVPGLTVGLGVYYKQSRYQLDEGQFGAPVFLTPFNYDRAWNAGVELTGSWTFGNFSGYGNLAAAQQQGKGIVSSQALFTAEDFAFIQQHYVVTDHSQLITASAGLSYLWNGTRLSLDLIAGSGLRRTVHTPNDSSNPPYQQLNLGVAHRFRIPAIGRLEARFDVINVLGYDYVLRDGTGIGVFAKQFGPPRGFFGGIKKEF